MSTATIDPETVGHDLYFKVVGSDGSASVRHSRTWGSRGNATVLSARIKEYAESDAKDLKEAKKGDLVTTHTVIQITEQQYRAQAWPKH